MNKKKVLIIVGIILALCIIGFSVYKIVETTNTVNKDNEVEENNKEKTKKEDNSNKNNFEYNAEINTNDFDYDSMSSDIKTQLQDNEVNAYIVTCKNEGDVSSPNFVTNYQLISNDSFDTTITKLKGSTSYNENITASFMCPEYSYLIGKVENNAVVSKIMTLNYNHNKMLIVGYDGIGYAFKYDTDDEIENFIHDLK